MASIALGNHFEEFVKKQLESGRYNNASEVVRAGLRMLEDYEEGREKWLEEEIQGRYDEMLKDPSKGIPAATVRARFEAKHQARMAKAK